MKDENQDNNDGSKTVVTKEQFDELQANLNKVNELLKAKEDSITALEGANKTLVEEKRDEESKKEASRIEKLTADGKHDEVLKEKDKAYQNQIDTLQGDFNRVNARLNGQTGKSVLEASLKEAGVSDIMLPVVETFFTSSWTFEDGVPMHNGMHLADSVRTWKDSDAGKPFVTSDNSGSGAEPSTSNQPSNKTWEEMSHEERLASTKED